MNGSALEPLPNYRFFFYLEWDENKSNSDGKKKSLRPKSDVPFPGYQQVMLERAGAAEAQGVCDKVLLPSFQTLGPDSVSASQTPVC